MKRRSLLNISSGKVYSRLITYFFQGLFLFLPIVLTAFTIYWAFDFIDSRLNPNFKTIGKIPGLGVVILLFGIILLGYLGSTVIFRSFWLLIDRFFLKFPLTRYIYPAFKDIFSAVMGKEKNLNTPVLFRISKESDVERIGFITEDDLSKLGIGTQKVAVYAPHSYNFSGNVYIVPVKDITRINIEASEAMKFVVSGGMIKIQESGNASSDPSSGVDKKSETESSW